MTEYIVFVITLVISVCAAMLWSLSACDAMLWSLSACAAMMWSLSACAAMLWSLSLIICYVKEVSYGLMKAVVNDFLQLRSDNVRVMVIVWRLRVNIIRTALCSIV